MGSQKPGGLVLLEGSDATFEGICLETWKWVIDLVSGCRVLEEGF